MAGDGRSRPVCRCLREANDIDIDLLAQVDDQLLKDIGISSAGCAHAGIHLKTGRRALCRNAVAAE
jgi:hypothetical protein